MRFSAHSIEPQVEPLIGFPGSWTPGTNGAVIADVVRVQIESEADFERYRGTLKGKIVLTQPARAVRMLEGPFVLRMTDKDFEEAATVPGGPRRADAAGAAARGGRGDGRGSLQQKLQQFYKAEGVVALFDRGSDSRHVRRRQRSLLAAAAARRRHDLPDAAAARAAPTPAPGCRR